MRKTLLIAAMAFGLASNVAIFADETLPSSSEPPAADPAASPAALPVEVLSDSGFRTIAPENPPGIPPIKGHVEEAAYDLAIPWGETRFEAYRAAYLSADGRRWLSAILDRARPYLSYVMERIDYYGLPEELAFLPVIESEYSSKAVSRSGATGIWQFMRNSIGGYGMRIDDWVDERRDFMKSTDAALRKLSDNEAILGDWNLAIAAYNMGLGAITRAVATSGNRDFWQLREKGFLSKETSDYVPKFLAVASILRYPGRNGVAISWEAPPEWESVELGRSIDLGLLSDATELPLDKLKAVNAELRYAVTPPWPSYRLKVPSGTAASVTAVLSDASRKLLRYNLHTVRSGDSISALSRAFGAPIPLIVEANPGLDPNRIKIGQVIVVPVVKEGAQAPAAPVDDEPPLFGASYVVAKGDSLWSISLRYNVSPETLASRNGLELASVIREGSSLSVPILKP